MNFLNQKVKKFGVGLGLRREHFDSLLADFPGDIDFLEVAPENYMKTGGRIYRQFRQIVERYPLVVHGLTLSIGNVGPIDFGFLKELKKFLRQFDIAWMSDHLCFASSGEVQYYDLIPLPFNEEVLKHVVERAKVIQDFLELPLALENVSYYTSLGNSEMSELEFVSRVVEEADCALHLDINNVYVNSVNHGFNPYQYIDRLPLHRVIHGHMAGHLKREENWLVDTHGEAICKEVWDLFRYTIKKVEFPAILIERDFNIPPLEELLTEMRYMKKLIYSSSLEICKSDHPFCNPKPKPELALGRDPGSSRAQSPPSATFGR